MFSDLECDYINPIDLCTQLNRVRNYDFWPVHIVADHLAACVYLHRRAATVCHPGIHSARFPRAHVLALWAICGTSAKFTVGSLQHPKVSIFMNPGCPH